MEVIKGLAITAGSSFNAFAAMGSTAPTILADSTVANRASQTTKFTMGVMLALPSKSPSTSHIFR